MHLNSSVTIERKRVDCNALPKGWQREEVLRKSGISAGKVDVYYYSPTGRKIESKPQLARYLGDAFDISSFDFQTGKTIQHLPPPSISLYRCSAVLNNGGGGSGGGGVGGPPSGNPSGINLSTALIGGGVDSGGGGAGCGGGGVGSCGGGANSNINSYMGGGGGIVVGVGVGGGTATATATNLAAAAAAAQALKRKYKTASSAAGAIPAANVTITPSTGSSASLRQQLEISRALRTDASLVPPIRQTASIFKQPVTVVRNHENNKVKHDSKQPVPEKPKQIFWEKRLERLRACHATGEPLEEISLPRNMRSVGPNIGEQTLLQSVATALHVLNSPVTGQTSTKTELSKNTMAFMNPEQPLIQAVIISDDDIRRQEERVNAVRRKLQDALKA